MDHPEKLATYIGYIRRGWSIFYCPSVLSNVYLHLEYIQVHWMKHQPLAEFPKVVGPDRQKTARSDSCPTKCVKNSQSLGLIA
jgi:hypothetical protein